MPHVPRGLAPCPSRIVRPLPLALAAALAFAPAFAITIHRSFRPAYVGTGGSTGVVVPSYNPDKWNEGFDYSVAQTKEKTLTGKVFRVVDGRTLMVKPMGGSWHKVLLDRVDVPRVDEPSGPQAKAFLAGLLVGKTVEVRYSKESGRGDVQGTVFLKHAKGLVDVNLTMIRNGYARHAKGDNTVAYGEAQQKARLDRLGIWASGR